MTSLVLFDLDHTLIPFDSGLAWTRFLIQHHVLPVRAENSYLAYCQQYVAGTLDIHAMHRATMAPLLHHPRSLLAQWQQQFERSIAAQVPASMRALVRRHQDAGDLCAIVTATSRFVAEPFARLFGIAELIATESATVGGARTAAFTGEIDGDPCYRAFKLGRVERWLALQPMGKASGLDEFERTYFYSDSISDLPLLSAVTDPIAVRPDAALRAHALAHGWPVIEDGDTPGA